MSALQYGEHGTETRYVTGCRCDKCRESSRQARSARRGRPSVEQEILELSPSVLEAFASAWLAYSQAVQSLNTQEKLKVARMSYALAAHVLSSQLIRERGDTKK